MRRILIGVAVTALTIMASAGPASASPGQVTHIRFHGGFASADWSSNSATSNTNTFVSVSASKQGSVLYAEQFTSHLDENGNVTGGTDTFALGLTSGFSFTIDHATLASAGLSGSGLPATTCTVDAGGRPISCSDTTIGVNVTWTGQGPITRSVYNSHSKTGLFIVSEHSNGTQRDATATATFAGFPEPPGELQFAALGISNSGTTTICIGTTCPPNP